MSDKPREFDHPCKQTCSGWKQGFERGVDQSTKEIAALEALLEKCREALKDSVENRMVANQVACEKNYREILREGIGKTKETLAMLAEHKMKGSGG